MNKGNDTIVAVSTPPGIGALAVIRVSGPGAFACADLVFSGKKRLSDAKSHSVHFGVIKDEDEIIDEVVATVFIGPRSFTGEDTVEFSCHGSVYIQRKIMEVLLKNGARPAEPGEFSMRAFFNRKMDLTQAEAIGDLIASDTAASHRIALKQMRGGFTKEINELREKLIHFASLLELELDFSEEDVEFANRDQLVELIDELLYRITRLSDSFAQGNVIKNGIPVTIAGKPNAGKSTLLNLILNEERAIVSDIAGTTRDTIEEEITVGGIKYRFIDTAGIRETEDTIEKMGVGRSMDKIREAMIILYLFDPSETNAEALAKILEDIRIEKGDEKYKLIAVANKTDKYNSDVIKKNYHAFADVVFISAKNHTGINELMDAIQKNSFLDPLQSNDVILTNIRHKHLLDKTHHDLTKAHEGLTSKLSTDLIAVEIRSALHHLGELTGTISTDDLLDNIFSKFCIGK